MMPATLWLDHPRVGRTWVRDSYKSDVDKTCWEAEASIWEQVVCCEWCGCSEHQESHGPLPFGRGYASESVGEFCRKVQMPRLHPRRSRFHRLRVGLEICVSSHCSHDSFWCVNCPLFKQWEPFHVTSHILLIWSHYFFIASKIYQWCTVRFLLRAWNQAFLQGCWFLLVEKYI